MACRFGVSRVVRRSLSALLVIALLATVDVPPSAATEPAPVWVATWSAASAPVGYWEPYDVAVDSTGDVFVIDFYAATARVLRFGASGALETQWDLEEFAAPRGIAVDASGNVYVTDSEHHTVTKYTSAGAQLAQWGSEGDGDGQFEGAFSPTGIAVDSDGNVYVTEHDSDRVQKFTGTGTYLTQWAVNNPWDVEVDSAGDVYVAEAWSADPAVKKFTSSGTFVTEWGEAGTGDGQFEEPHGLAIDADDDVYVSDGQLPGVNHRIQKFTSSGTFLTRWGTQGTGAGEFQHPFGIAVNRSAPPTPGADRVYVADLSNRRVQVFAPANPSLTVTKSADQATVAAGQDIDWQIEIINTGNVALTGVTVADVAAPDCSGPVADIAAGAERTVSCSTTTVDPDDLGTYSNTASVTTNEVPGPTTSNQVDVEVVPCTGHPFGDVPAWVEDAVDWAYCETYMTGYPGDLFRPDWNITRAQVARLLYRVEGSPDVSALPPHGFSDVPAWVEDAVTWMAANDYATGYQDDTFRPDLPITRAQVTRMQYRINGSPTGSPPHPFTDVPAWVDSAVDWIVDPANDPPYATGYPGDLYRPNWNITRAQTTRMTCRINTTPGTC